MADNASMFDASRFRQDKERRAAFLKVAEEFFDQESQNSWDGQFTESGRSSTDDGKARSQYFREVEILKKETRLKGSEGCEWGNPFKIGR